MTYHNYPGLKMGNLIFKIFENLISAGPCMKIRDSLKNKAFAPISAIPTVKKRGNVCLKIVPI